MAEMRRNSHTLWLIFLTMFVTCLACHLPSNTPPQSSEQDQHQRVIALHKQKLQEAFHAGDQEGMAAEFLALGKIHSVPGEEADEILSFRAASRILRSIGDVPGQVWVLHRLGRIYADLGLMQDALAYYNQAMDLQQMSSDHSAEGELLRDMGDVYSNLGQRRKASEYYKSASKFPPTPPGSATSDPPTPKKGEVIDFGEEILGATDDTQEIIAQVAAAKARAQAATTKKIHDLKQSNTGGPAVSVSARTVHSSATTTTAKGPATQIFVPLINGIVQTSSLSHVITKQQSPPDINRVSYPKGSDSPNRSAASPAGPPLAEAESSIERYPNIEAPDTVAAGQEIAAQVSLTAEQISSETIIVSGAKNQGKLQLPMPEGERQWTITVNLIAPGMEITRGGSNTATITIDRDGDSTIAAFYLRAQPLDPAANGKRDTRILATLWHDGAFLARIARPLTIIAVAEQPDTANQPLAVSSANAADRAHAPSAVPAPAPATASRPTLTFAPHSGSPPLIFNPAIAAPDLTIEENRVGNTLVIVFRDSGDAAPVKAEIANPDQSSTPDQLQLCQNVHPWQRLWRA